MKLEIGPEVTPAIGMEAAVHLATVIVDPVDAGKAFMTDGIV